MPLHRIPAWVLVALSVVLLTLVGLAAADADGRSEVHQLPWISATSHHVTRSGTAKVCPDNAGCSADLKKAPGTLPVHAGGAVIVRVGEPAQRLCLRIGNRCRAARSLEPSGQRWRAVLPASEPRHGRVLVIVEARLPTSTASLAFELRYHRHRR